MKKFLSLLILALMTISMANAQTKAKYNYAAQKKLIPAELGKVYLGMPLNEFAKQFDLSKADVGDTRFDWFVLTIPFQKGNVNELTVKIHGLTQDDKKALLKRETVLRKDVEGNEYEEETDRLILDKISEKGFVYAMYINFKKDFDLKTYVVKTYGKGGEVRKPDDEYHIFDIQWTKKTGDGLDWLIRSFHESDDKTLQLLGRIDGTEWGLEN